MSTKHAHILHRTMMAATALLMLTVLQACGSKDEPTVPDPEPPKTENATRTILVYMVATNNLGTGNFDRDDMDEMERAASESDFGGGRLLAYHATSKGLVLKEFTAEGVDTLKVYDTDQLSVSIDRMRQVIADVKTLAPADDYGLILWSHASAWIQDGVKENQPQRSFGSDGYVNGKTMNTTSLREAIKDAGFGFVYFDCCFMGSAEVFYELRDCAPYLIGSPAEVPAEGMPYHLNLPYLFDTKSSDGLQYVSAAKRTFELYWDTETNTGTPCTMVVVRSDRIKAMAEAAGRIYGAATRTYDPAANYQLYYPRNRYYYDFGQYMESICDDPVLLESWQQAMDDMILYKAASTKVGIDCTPVKLEHYSGLSSYILKDKATAADKGYNTLSWYTDVASKLFE